MRVSGALLPALLAVSLQGGCTPEPRESGPMEVPRVLCDIDAAPCTGTAGEVAVTIDIVPRPVRAMANLTFRVTATAGGEPVRDDAVAVELTMPGMVMGENRIILGGVGEGRYEGSGVIVRCPTGGRLWRATVFSPSVPHLRFDFEVDAP